MKNKIFYPVLFIFIFFGCKSNNPSEQRLVERVKGFHKFMQSGNYEYSWEYLMAISKEPQNWPNEKWIKFWRKASENKKVVYFQIKSISVMKKDGTHIGIVKIIYHMENIKQKTMDTIEMEEGWSFENNNWFRFEDV